MGFWGCFFPVLLFPVNVLRHTPSSRGFTGCQTAPSSGPQLSLREQPRKLSQLVFVQGGDHLRLEAIASGASGLLRGVRTPGETDWNRALIERKHQDENALLKRSGSFQTSLERLGPR